MNKLSILVVILASSLLAGIGCGTDNNGDPILPPVPPTVTDTSGQNNNGGTGTQPGGESGGGSTGGGEASTSPQSLRASQEGDRFLRLGWYRLAEAAYGVAVKLGAGPETQRLQSLAKWKITAVDKSGDPAGESTGERETSPEPNGAL